MNIYVEEIKRIFKNVNIKRPKFNLRLPKVDWSTITIKKPSRGLVVAIAILLEIVLIFIILWVFDDRTIFDNDYVREKYGRMSLKWGWFHNGVAITFILMLVAWFFLIFNEFIAYKKEERTFYRLYKKKNEY